MAIDLTDLNIPEDCPYTNGYILDYGDGSLTLELSGFNYIPQERDPYYTIKDGDTLSNLSFARYQNSRWWWVLAIANNIIDPFDLITGTTIIIPDLEVVKLSLQ